MSDINLGSHFEEFVQAQLESGRFRDTSEVVRAGLRLLEDQEADRVAALAEIKRKIAESLDDPRPSIPSAEVFTRLDRKHAERMKKRVG